MDAATRHEASGLHSALRYKFIAIVGNENVRAASAADAVAGVQPKLVIEAGTESEIAEILRLSNAADLAVIPRGGSTKLGWGNPPSRADLVLSTARLNEITAARLGRPHRHCRSGMHHSKIAGNTGATRPAARGRSVLTGKSHLRWHALGR